MTDSNDGGGALQRYGVALIGRKLKTLDYRYDDDLAIGSVVRVPLRGKESKGVVVEGPAECGTCEGLLEIAGPPEGRYDSYQLATARFIADYYGCSLGEALGLFTPHPVERPGLQPPEVNETIELLPAQQEALERLASHPAALLFAPTGSGKTEIYMKLIARTLAENRSAIFLMPEISLTPQMEKRLKAHFGDTVALWHSKLTKKRREETLARIRGGEVRIVAGPRSALFLPLHEIGLIVVDEEHDDSYKAHNRPRYHARDVALYMGRLLGARVVLGSATPSATTYARQPVVRIDKPYIQTKKRYRFERGGCRLTPDIVDAIGRHAKEGGQAIVFLPTRANFKYLYCESCGYHLECPYCAVGMSLHRKARLVRCHYCGYAEKIPSACPKCGGVMQNDRMGTAEVVEALRERFGELRIEQFDKDTITTANKLQKTLERFGAREIDVLVGTQMLAKGHDYADVTLAVILGLDYILALPDYRARERAMALFVQIAGRAGRAREAEVIVQTNEPEFFEEYVGRYEAFLQSELEAREGLYPPTRHLCRLLFSAREEAKGAAAVAKVKGAIEALGLVEVVGAGKAPIERIAGKWRFTILLRSTSRKALLQSVKAVEDGSFEVDMDPVDFA
ncbi:primosomal protein N' [Hydrogenimonas sp.]